MNRRFGETHVSENIPSTWVHVSLRAMPTVLRLGGLRVVIYPNDHSPPHVHVIGPAGEAIFRLNCPAGPPALRESMGFKVVELNRLEATLTTATDFKKSLESAGKAAAVLPI